MAEIGRYLVEAHLREGRSVAELAKAHGVHRSWLYKLLARYRAEGDAGLAPRSRRPHRSPSALRPALVREILGLRRQLIARGLDGGAETIHWHLTRRGRTAPSVSTIWRLLRREGLVVSQPRKRPRSSLIRFVAALPNECWQADMTHWTIARGREVEIVNVIDDHSRLCVGAASFPVTRAIDTAAVFARARRRYGTPQALLTDNGCIFTAAHRGGKVVLQTELGALGVTHKHARPYHPQTCGKVERFHQTMKRYLAKQRPARTLGELELQLARFRLEYNERRPHRALGRRTPGEVWRAKVKATPVGAASTHFRIRHDKVDRHGKLTLRYESKLLHLGMGARHRGQAVVMLVADRDVRVLSPDGVVLGRFTIDPARNYQAQSMAVAV